MPLFSSISLCAIVIVFNGFSGAGLLDEHAMNFNGERILSFRHFLVGNIFGRNDDLEIWESSVENS